MPSYNKNKTTVVAFLCPFLVCHAHTCAPRVLTLNTLSTFPHEPKTFFGAFTFVWIIPGRCLEQRHAGSKRHVLPVLYLLEVVGVASLLVSLSLLVLHLLLIHGPSLQLLRTPLLGRSQSLHTGHLVQLLQLLDQLHMAGHDAGGQDSRGG